MKINLQFIRIVAAVHYTWITSHWNNLDSISDEQVKDVPKGTLIAIWTMEMQNEVSKFVQGT